MLAQAKRGARIPGAQSIKVKLTHRSVYWLSHAHNHDFNCFIHSVVKLVQSTRGARIPGAQRINRMLMCSCMRMSISSRRNTWIVKFKYFKIWAVPKTRINQIPVLNESFTIICDGHQKWTATEHYKKYTAIKKYSGRVLRISWVSASLTPERSSENKTPKR